MVGDCVGKSGATRSHLVRRYQKGQAESNAGHSSDNKANVETRGAFDLGAVGIDQWIEGQAKIPGLPAVGRIRPAQRLETHGLEEA